MIRQRLQAVFWLVAIACVAACDSTPRPWSEEETAVLEALSIQSLPELPPDPSNRVADDPRAAALGRQLFFDTRLSANDAVSCATCHQPARHFTDGLQRGVGIGTSQRNTPSIVGTAYSPWLYWDGRRDSHWSQALSPLEDPNEHGSDRHAITTTILGIDVYRRQYESVFGKETDADTVFANVGKALAAFERTIMPTPSRFDEYVAAVTAGDDERQHELFNDDEIRGLRLFIGKANCTQCHNGPLLTNNEFHNTGLINLPGEVPDKGRVVGVREVMNDPFNCRGDFSDDPSPSCSELEFARRGTELIGAFRTPSLRNIAGTAPYGHQGQVPTLAAMLRHYNDAPDAMIGHNEAKPLGLGRAELRQLEAFLGTLEAPSSFVERLSDGRLQDDSM